MTPKEELGNDVHQGVSEKLTINPEALSHVRNGSLFYPCSGEDFDVPVKLFSPLVTDFWFVDKGYFCLENSAESQPPVLEDNSDYQLIDKNIAGPVIWAKSRPDIEPCVLTETYQHIPSKRVIRIHRRRGYGFSAFRTEINSLGVFFYRGDSLGEGGSGNLWLTREHLDEVCNKLIDGGLIVTDGSNHGRSNHTEYQEFWNHCNASGSVEGVMKSARQFTDMKGRSFTCVGYAGKRYGHTLIWQVEK